MRHPASRRHPDRWDEPVGVTAWHFAARDGVAEEFGQVNTSIAGINGELARVQDRLFLRLGGLILTCAAVVILVQRYWK